VRIPESFLSSGGQVSTSWLATRLELVLPIGLRLFPFDDDPSTIVNPDLRRISLLDLEEAADLGWHPYHERIP
jgi:hypothetical protein